LTVVGLERSVTS